MPTDAVRFGADAATALREVALRWYDCRMTESLWSSFVGALPPGRARARAASADDATQRKIEAALNAIRERGRQAWPRLEVHEDAMVLAAVRAVAAAQDQPAIETLVRVHAEDLHLATACAGGDERAIAVFQREYAPVIARAHAAAEHSEAAAEEVQQAVWVRLFVDEAGRPAKIGAYEGRGKLANWLRVVTARARTDLLRKRLGRYTKPPPLVDATPELAASPELLHLKETYRENFRDAFARALEDLEPGERNLLRQRLVFGLRVEQMAALFRIHPATVKRRIARARERIATQTQRHLLESLRVEPGELESILRLIHSRMDVSVGRLLERRP